MGILYTLVSIETKSTTIYGNGNETSRLVMARRRALLTDTERELLSSGNKSDRYYQAVSRVRTKINEELSEDIQIIEKHNPELIEELRGVVCEDK